MRLHIDTDFGGDTDDACALAMVLGWPGADVVGITTTADPDGQRAGYVARFLELAGRDGIPVAAGAGRSATTGQPMGDIPDHDRYWPMPVHPAPAPAGAAVDLLDRSIGLGATVVAIGPYTNLAALADARPGRRPECPWWPWAAGCTHRRTGSHRGARPGTGTSSATPAPPGWWPAPPTSPCAPCRPP
ncbi:MAG TPA: nucleoside hydrolase [Mycobacteriales bacterium]|nr:nucleoside hydrolase [Mycobacteriales bacterium]